jgi:hypothetical protein
VSGQPARQSSEGAAAAFIGRALECSDPRGLAGAWAAQARAGQRIRPGRFAAKPFHNATAEHRDLRSVAGLGAHAIAAALLVAGCGGSSSSGKAGGVNTVRAAYVSSRVAGYQIGIKVTGTAAGQAINVTGTGAFDEAPHAGRLTMNMTRPTLGGQSLQIKAIILGKDLYVKLAASLVSEPVPQACDSRSQSRASMPCLTLRAQGVRRERSAGATAGRLAHRCRATRRRRSAAQCRNLEPPRGVGRRCDG